jgi:large subunit ribosomal protein L9
MRELIILLITFVCVSCLVSVSTYHGCCHNKVRLSSSPRADLASPLLLAAKKNNKKGGSLDAGGGGLVKTTVGTTAVKGKKGDIRVRLNEEVKGVGRRNEVVFVSGAMFNNVLSPRKKAVRVSDDENAANIQKALEDAKQAEEEAIEILQQIQSLEGEVIERNVGPDGSLFGVVAGKHVLDHLKGCLGRDLPAKCEVKAIVRCTGGGAEGKEEEDCPNVEAKREGNYVASVMLNEKSPLAKFKFQVGQK